jgi:SIR2-like domain
MQFIPNGPDIPNQLLQAHEEGRVAFFCGAGISYPAGLPGFKDLVDEIYKNSGAQKTEIEKEAYDSGRFDTTLDLLERRILGQSSTVRTALAKALNPNLDKEGSTTTHAALLDLASNRDGSLHLVTTNFDRIFNHVISQKKLNICEHDAPCLPVPKNSRWDGLVYLHGLLPQKIEANNLNHLVITSGDFGLAYITERWAARFVSDLFKNFIVCFVGYSIDDPVLRYLMDAIAADRRSGETAPEAYAFAPYKSGQETKEKIKWEAKGVIPIMYESIDRDHSALHRTIDLWAQTYRDGIQGKERIVVELALSKPSTSSKQDDFVGKMQWALSDPSGLPAKRFAELEPVPPLEWLEALSEDRFCHADLPQFGVVPLQKPDKNLKFSLTCRPAPYTHAHWMMLTSSDPSGNKWDKVMSFLAHWLLRYLNKPELLLLLTQHGGRLQSQFLRAIQSELNRFSELEHEDNTIELNRIRAASPDAIPCPPMRILWNLLINNRVKLNQGNSDLYN